jgi:diaminohydroxyphosphoribosylaminopyrimidine deaminase/5-amino-6-(5-phosphoribosylamino)uracil reductase
MPDFNATDNAYMARALELAERGCYGAHPNPMVGCVIVRDGDIIGEGWHERAGGPHAEINALAEAGEAARGAAVFVSLEPCAHHGKTPPCADALIDAGISRVIVAMQDPFPAVAGQGIRKLRDAGVEVDCGLLEERAEELNRGYLSRVRRGRPWLTLKIAASLDGCVAMANGESQWITGPEARADVQRYRARSGAVLSGIGTVLADDPSFTVRDESLGDAARQPLRVILDSRLRMPLSASMLDQPGDTLVFCADDANRAPLENTGAKVAVASGADDRVDLLAALEELGRREINAVFAEAGPGIAGSLVERGLVDELVIYQAPHIMGSETAPMFRTPRWTRLADRRELQVLERQVIGDDLRITARLRD